MTLMDIPAALHRSEDELPFVTLEEGVEMQVLQIDIPNGLWVIRSRFQPGTRVQKHKHTGQVFAFTLSGSWKYEEYDDVNTAGSYLFEPAGSIHTLIVPATNTEVTDVWFAIYGANLNLAEDGSVDLVIDAQMVYEFYVALCEADGHGKPNVIGM